MLSRSINIFVFFLGLFLSAQISAEAQLNNQHNTIILHDAIAKTFQHNPALKTFNYQLKAQQGRQLQASLKASPEVNLMIEDAFGTGNFEGTENAQTTLSIGWILEGEKRQGYIDVAQAGSLSLATESSIKRLDAAAETARLYLNCLASQARLINAVKPLALAKETVLVVKKRVNAGKAPEAELARAQANVARRELEHEDIEHELRSAIRILAAQWGDTNPAFSRVEGNIANLPAITSFETLKLQLEKSPSFTRLLSEKRLKQAELKLAEAQGKPDWRLDFGVRHIETTSDQALLAGITIPFGERSSNKGGITQARENLSQTAAKEEELRVNFETSLYTIYQELQHSLHRITAYRDNIIPQLDSALKQTGKAYDLGRYSYFEWHSIQTELLDARSALVEASIDAHLKAIEIERLTGVSMAQPTTR